MLSRYTLYQGRRMGDRRNGAATDTFVDRHGAGLFLVAMIIIALNILDAFFTVHLLSHGGQELNPVVDLVLQQGVGPFVFCKSLCIGLCIVLLSLTKNFRIARIGLAVVVLGYGALLGWHLHLVSFLDSL